MTEWTARSTERLYECDIDYLHDPSKFSGKNLVASTDLINITRREVESEKSIRLMYKGTINSVVAKCWVNPLSVLSRLSNENITLLQWISKWDCADDIVKNLKNNKSDGGLFGVGEAAGDKCCRLFIKLLIHTYRLIDSTDPRWNQNSYTLPLDQNVGRVLMRSGLLYLFTDHETFKNACCVRQNGGRFNFGVNKLIKLEFGSRTDPQVVSRATKILTDWHPKARKLTIPIGLNAILAMVAERHEFEPSIGELDDGLMYIAKTYCDNNPEKMHCKECPLRNVCRANNGSNGLKSDYYAGSGEGTISGR